MIKKKPALKPVPELPLEKKSWLATASIPDGTFVFSNNKIDIDGSAANAIDGDHWTGWRDTTKTQYPGQWLQVDMKKTQSFDRIDIDNTWAQWDSPNKYEVTVSEDAKKWSTPIATGTGQPGMTSIEFPRQSARYIRITQTGSDPKYNWSIFELDVFLKKSGRPE